MVLMKLIISSCLISVLIINFASYGTNYAVVSAAELAKSSAHSGRVDNFLAILKQASRQGASYLSDLVVSVPITKILLAGGALLSLFFMFARLIIVLGPIILLGAMTRESTDTTDFLKMLIEFYNQIIVALDDQTDQNQPQSY